MKEKRFCCSTWSSGVRIWKLWYFQQRYQKRQGGRKMLWMDVVDMIEWMKKKEKLETLEPIPGPDDLLAPEPEIPAEPPGPPGSLGVITTDAGKVITLSENIARAIEESDVQLKGDQTWVAIMYVAERPEYMSEIIPLAHSGSGSPYANLILEPGIMKQVKEALDRDRIKYSDDETEGE